MTTQEIINRLCIIKRDWPGAASDIDKLLLVDLEAQLRLETAARSGNVNATRTIAKLLKDLEKDPREGLRYPWIDEEGRQCVCDGFQAYRLREHLPLIERPANAGKAIDLSRVIPPSVEGWKSLPMPSAKEIRSFIATERAKWTGRRCDFAPKWDFGPNEPSVNAYYLLNAAQVFPDAAEIFWDTLVTPLVVRGEIGEAVILPIRCQGKSQLPAKSDAEQKAMDAAKAFRDEQEAKQRAEADRVMQAHHEASEAAEDAKSAKLAMIAALSDAKIAETDEQRNEALERARNAGKAQGVAILRHHKAMCVYDEDAYMTPEEFAEMVSLLYGDNAA